MSWSVHTTSNSSLGRSRHCMVTTEYLRSAQLSTEMPVPVPVCGHELVEAAVGVRDARGGHRGHRARRLRGVPAEEVAEAGEDARHAAGVGVLAAEERHAGEAAPVRPRAGLHHAALHVGEHGEDLGEQPRAVGARELQRLQAPERRRPRGPIPRPQRLQNRATRTVRNPRRPLLPPPPHVGDDAVVG